MARTKGAKGKKTLAKEMGMTLEQYERYLQEGISNLLKNKEDKNKLIEKEFKEPFQRDLNVITPPDLEKIKKKEKEDKLILIPKPEKIEIDNLKFPDKPLKSLESPGIKFSELPDLTKTPYLLEPLEPIESQSILPTTPPVRKRKEKEIPVCERCHKTIAGFEFKVNLNYLTTYPDYHRQTESDKGKVLLCGDCKKELNKLIDRWLWNKGKGVPLKFGATEFSDESGFLEDKPEQK